MASKKPLTLFQIIMSVLAAMFGVQKNENRERDFANGHPAAFIVTGIIFTILFVVVMIGIVQWVLS